VLAADALIVLGVIRARSVARGARKAERGSVRELAKTGLERLGYRLARTPPLAADPAHSLELDFEYVLAHYLARRHDPRPFFFVQVGAFDGTTHDRLHEHVREKGWHGVLVEPQPSAFARLEESYEGVDSLTLVNAAVDRERGSRALHIVQDAHGEPIDSLRGLASFDRERLVEWLRKDGPRNPRAGRIGSEPVSCVTFEDVLADTAYVDLLHIDVEGYDLELLKLFDFARFAPPIVRFEHVHLSRADWDEAVRLLARHGYRTVREEYDTTAYLGPPRGR
jgi:FkbM family methyltransferase